MLVFGQSRQFLRVGADINLTPNAVRATAARPTHRISRSWDSGEETSRLAMGGEAERSYGAGPFSCLDTRRMHEGARPAAGLADWSR